MFKSKCGKKNAKTEICREKFIVDVLTNSAGNHIEFMVPNGRVSRNFRLKVKVQGLLIYRTDQWSCITYFKGTHGFGHIPNYKHLTIANCLSFNFISDFWYILLNFTIFRIFVKINIYLKIKVTCSSTFIFFPFQSNWKLSDFHFRRTQYCLLLWTLIYIIQTNLALLHFVILPHVLCLGIRDCDIAQCDFHRTREYTRTSMNSTRTQQIANLIRVKIVKTRFLSESLQKYNFKE